MSKKRKGQILGEDAGKLRDFIRLSRCAAEEPVSVEVGDLKLLIPFEEFRRMTVYGAGQRGGQRLLEKHGSDYYRTIGQRGGQRIVEDRGPEYFEQLGSKGGNALKEKYGAEHFEKIGTAGGNALKDKVYSLRSADRPVV